MTFLDFFAGIGGFRLGMERAGHKCLGFCEYDKFAVASYTAMHCITEEQKQYLETLNFRKRREEVLHEEYRNNEWYAKDIRDIRAEDIPVADCWCFGFPCQDISVAGQQTGFRGNRSSLFFAVTKLIRELPEENKPSYLFIENVKNLLGVNRGFDFARLLVELDEIGYDAEWQVLNSADFGVPQHRERIFIIGHLRNKRTAKVFPLTGTDGQNHIHKIAHRKGYINNLVTYAPDGISGAVEARDGGNTEPHVAQFCDLTNGAGFKCSDKSRALAASYYKGQSPFERNSGIVMPVISPERANKDQHGRRMKDAGEDIFTLTGEDRHGVAIVDGKEITIRKLTPRECFRLQGWPDEYFDRAAMVNSDSQLYKQAGNGVTVTVVEAIADKMKVGGEI